MAADNARAFPVRLLICVSGATLFGLAFGWKASALAFAAITAAEGFGSAVSREPRPGDPLLTILRLAGIVLTSMVWTTMAVVYRR